MILLILSLIALCAPYNPLNAMQAPQFKLVTTVTQAVAGSTNDSARAIPDTTFDLPPLVPLLAKAQVPKYLCNAYVNKWDIPGPLLARNDLRQRLCHCYPMLTEGTELIENLTKEKLSIHAVIFYVDLAIHDYVMSMQQRGRTHIEALHEQHFFEQSRFDILKRIFWNHKEVIALLAESGYSKPMLKRNN